MAATLDECQIACVKKSTCTGIDWNPEEQMTRKMCYLHVQRAYYGLYALTSGLVHYDLTRTAPCDGTVDTLLHVTVQ
jgi:hypothetical protein